MFSQHQRQVVSNMVSTEIQRPKRTTDLKELNAKPPSRRPRQSRAKEHERTLRHPASPRPCIWPATYVFRRNHRDIAGEVRGAEVQPVRRQQNDIGMHQQSVFTAREVKQVIERLRL